MRKSYLLSFVLLLAIVLASSSQVKAAAPVMTNSSITSNDSNFYQTSTLYGWCSATDADNTSVSYSYNWYLNGLPEQTGTYTSPVSQLWNVTAGGTGDDYGNAMTLDSSGDIYVAGSTNSFGAGNSDVWLLEYNSSGSPLWNVTTGGAGEDGGNAITLDSSGDIYVAGSTNSFGAGGFDIWLLKYNSSGSLLWNVTTGGAGDDYAYGIALDPAGNIYVTGTTTSFNVSSKTVWTLKYNNSGTLLWNTTALTSGSSNQDMGLAIAPDTSGNVYVTATTDAFGAGGFDIWLLKYNSSGSLLWNTTEGGIHTEVGYSMVLDNTSGDIYVAGETNSFGAGNFNIWLLKYDSSGSLLWNVTTGGTGDDYGYGIALDASGNIYVTGTTDSFGAGGSDIWLLKYDSSGGLLWNATAGGAGDDEGWAIAPDASGNTYVTGFTNSFGAGGYDAWLLKYKSPTPQWVQPGVLVNVANLTSALIPGQDWTFECSATDGNLTSAPLSSSAVTILNSSNTPPSISVPVLAPPSPSSAADLQCNATAVDAENPVLDVEYTWYNSTTPMLWGNTSVQSNVSSLISTLPHTSIHKNEVWNCTVRAFDGSLFSNYSSAKSTIVNSPPSAISMRLVPSSPSITDNIDCRANITDTDNDSLTVFWYWYLDTTLKYSGNTSGIISGTDTLVTTLAKSNLSTYDHWNCTIRAFDGTNYSSFASHAADVRKTTSNSGGGGGGGGGGGSFESSDFWQTTFAADIGQVESGYSQLYRTGQRLRIRINGDDHYVGVVFLTSNSVTINVSSTIQQATLHVNESRKFEVTGDNFYDLYVKLNSVVNGQANLTIQEIHELIASPASPAPQNPNSNPVEVVTTPPQQGIQNQTTSGQQQLPGISQQKMPSLNLIAAILVAIIIIIPTIIFLVTKRRSPPPLLEKAQPKTQKIKSQDDRDRLSGYNNLLPGSLFSVPDSGIEIPKKLLDYVKLAMSKHLPPDEIIYMLVNRGWPRRQAEAAVKLGKYLRSGTEPEEIGTMESVSKELKDYIELALSNGTSEQKIRSLLQEKGWPEDQINAAIKLVRR